MNTVDKKTISSVIKIVLVVLITVLVFSSSKSFATTFERESNDSMQDAMCISTSLWYSGSISDTTDKDFYEFAITEPGYVEIIFESGNSEGELEFNKKFWKISLTDVNGQILASKDFVANRDVLPRVELEAGTYYLVIEDSEYHESSYYSIWVKSMAADYYETEPNDNIITANQITTNEIYYGNISDSTDVDYYRFETTCNGTVDVFIAQNGSDYNEIDSIEVSLIDANENVYTDCCVNGEETSATTMKIGLPPGTYYVKASAYSQNDCSDATYTIKPRFVETTDWETEWNDDLKTADEITVNKTYHGTYNANKDFYKLRTSSFGTIDVKFIHDYQFDAKEFGNFEINIRDAEGNKCDCSYSGNIEKGSVQISANNLMGGTYYIAIESLHSNFVLARSYYTVEVKWTTNKPTGLQATTKTSNGKPRVTWEAVEGADKYEVWRKTGSSGTWKKQYTTMAREYVNTSAVVGKKYYYKVRAVFTDTDTFSEFSTSDYVTCDLAQPTGLKITTKASSGKPIVSWKKVSGADKYEVWRKAGSSGTWKKNYTSKGTSYTNTSATAGKVYYYKVKAIYEDNTTANSAFSTSYYVTCDLAQPTGLKVTTKASSGKPVVSWKKVSGADKYEVWRKVGSSGIWKKQYTSKGTSYINTSATAGKVYYYKVKAIYEDNTTANSAFSTSYYVTCDLARPKISVSGTKKPGRIVISWSKVSGADRYYIYRATSKKGTYKYYVSTRGTSYTNSSVREGKYYYYKVKAICDDRPAANSAYSNMDYARVR